MAVEKGNIEIIKLLLTSNEINFNIRNDILKQIIQYNSETTAFNSIHNHYYLIQF